MGKSVSDYYAEKMQKLLEAQKQSQKSASTPLSAPNKAAQSSQSQGRAYYDSFRKDVRTPAGNTRNYHSGTNARKSGTETYAKRPQQPPRQKGGGASYAPPRATVQGAGQGAGRDGSAARDGGKKKIPEQTLADRQREERAQTEAMEHAKRARQLRKMRDALISFVLILAVFAAMCFTVYRLLFVVSSIKVEGGDSYSTEDIIIASGVSEGDHLYSFRSSITSSLVSHRLPQIKEVDVERHIPSTIVFNITEDPCLYYTDFYGEYRGMSQAMRVLFSLSRDEAVQKGLVLLKLPAVQSAVAGEQIEFATLKNDSYIYETVEAVESSALSERIKVIDLRSKYDVRLVCDNKYLMTLGEAENVETKLRIAASLLEDEMFATEDKARIDLSDLSKTSVVIDNQLSFD